MANEPVSISVGTTPVRAVYANPKRSSLTILNTHTTAKVYYGRSNQVTTSDGIPIYSETAAVFLKGLGDRPDLEYWLISDTVATDVRVDESSELIEEV